MKKILFILPVILLGCAETFETHRVFAPSETIRNDKCADVQEFQIFQVTKGGALAFACGGEHRGCSPFNLTVFVPDRKGEEYWDDKVIRAPAGKCIAYEGVYRYTSKDERQRTIPRLRIVDLEIPNPAYKEWLKNQDKTKE